MSAEIETIIVLLKKKIISSGYKGYDPYDLLESDLAIVKKMTGKSLLPKLSFINKVLPINFRHLLKIEKTYNSKANALILHAFLNEGYEQNKEQIEFLYNWFVENKPSDYPEYFSAGFAFNISLKEYESGPGKTSLIISLFLMYALIDLYKSTNDQEVLGKIKLFEKLIDEKLPKYETDEELWYSYNFHNFLEVFNATAKIGKFYSLLYSIEPNEIYLSKIEKILKYILRNQRNDGTWPYSSKLLYSDGFHTAFILDSIYFMLKTLNNNENYSQKFSLGLLNYKENLFSNGVPLHFHPAHTATSHARSLFLGTELRDCAMAIVLFNLVGEKDSAGRVIDYTIKELFGDGHAYFYKNKFWTSKIDFIRWQAWLLYALTCYNYK